MQLISTINLSPPLLLEGLQSLRIITKISSSSHVKSQRSRVKGTTKGCCYYKANFIFNWRGALRGQSYEETEARTKTEREEGELSPNIYLEENDFAAFGNTGTKADLDSL